MVKWSAMEQGRQNERECWRLLFAGLSLVSSSDGTLSIKYNEVTYWLMVSYKVLSLRGRLQISKVFPIRTTFGKGERWVGG
jgi:hypothetical protein